MAERLRTPSHVSGRVLVVVLTLLVVAVLRLAGEGATGAWAADARDGTPGAAWGEPVTGLVSTYDVFAQDFVYGDVPFLITDVRDAEGRNYEAKESYEIRALSVYRAEAAGALLTDRPVIIFVHGGSWVDGYRDWYEFTSHAFTGELGWVTVVIDYRLTSDQVFVADEACADRATCALPESVAERSKAAWYPDPVADVAAAVAWVADHIDEHGGNPEEIFLFGHSAGAHLATLTATDPAYVDAQSHLRGVISMGGIYDLNALSEPVWQWAVDQTFDGGFDAPTLLSEASPVTHITGTANLPPFLLLHAEEEITDVTEQTLDLHRRMLRLGHRVALVELDGYNHGSEIGAVAQIGQAPTQVMVAWVDGVLHPRLYLPVVLR